MCNILSVSVAGGGVGEGKTVYTPHSMDPNMPLTICTLRVPMEQTYKTSRDGHAKLTRYKAMKDTKFKVKGTLKFGIAVLLCGQWDNAYTDGEKCFE